MNETVTQSQIRASNRTTLIVAAIDVFCVLGAIAVRTLGETAIRAIWFAMLAGQIGNVVLLIVTANRLPMRTLRHARVRSAHLRWLLWPVSSLALYLLLFGVAFMVYGKQ